MSIKEYHSKRKLFQQRFGSMAQSLENFASFCYCKYGYGFYQEQVGNAIHANKVILYNEKGQYRKLSKTDIYNHFLSDDKSSYLWFTASAKVLDELKLIPIVLDFDNKNDIEPAIFRSQVVEQLSKIELLKDKWINYSTHGSGIHCHVLLSFDKLDTNYDIRDKLNTLQRTLKGVLLGMDCIRGHPKAFDGAKIGKCGTLALSPLLRSEADAISFFQKQDVVSFEKLYNDLSVLSVCFIDTATDCGKPSNEDAKVCNKKQTSTTIHHCSSILQQQIVGNQAIHPQEGENLTQEKVLSKSPNERMIYAVQLFARKNKRLPSSVEAVLYYEELSLNTGQDKNNRRISRAEDAIKLVSKTFDTSKVEIPFSMKDAQELLVRLAIHPEDKIWKKGKNLSDELICKYLVYVTQLMTISHNNKELDGTVSKVQVIKSLKLNGQQYSRLKYIANDYDVIKTLSHSYIVGGPGKGVSKKYCFGSNHTLYKD